MDAALYRFGGFELDVPERQLRREGRVMPLRRRPFDLLAVFAGRPGVLLGKDELLERAWPGVVVDENNLQVQVSVLRRLLGAEAIATVPGHGYRFTLGVERVAREAAGEALVGREEDLARLERLGRESRLVTIVGAGGIGKTALARAWAASRDHAWVDLAAVRDGGLVGAEVDRALGGASEGTWLVLDNAEHLLESVGETVSALRRRRPAVHVLVTSQAPIALAGEQVYRLGPLPAPGALAFFEARARRLDPGFSLDAATRADAEALCRALDGNALALGMAAARAATMGVAAVARRLDERLGLLRAAERDAPERHRSLAAILEWSHALLAPVQRTVLARLSFLAPAFDLDIACAVVAAAPLAEDDVVEALSGLVERSLLAPEAGGFRLPESVRLFAAAKAAESPEAGFAARACAAYEEAGDAALAAGDDRAARAHFAQALVLAGDDGPRSLGLALKLGPAIQASLGAAHPAAEHAYRLALSRAGEGVPANLRYMATWGWWHFLCMCGRNHEAAPQAERIVEMAAASGDDGLLLEAHHAVMTTQDLLGHAPAVVEHARRVIALYDRERHHALTFRFGGHDPGVCALGQGAVGLWLCGEEAEALEMAARSEALAATLTHGYSRAVACFYAGLTYGFCGHVDDFRRASARLVALSDEHGMEMLLLEGRLLRERASWDEGDRGAVEPMLEALHAIEACGDFAFAPAYVSLVAEPLLILGRDAEAAALLDRGMGYAGLGQAFFLPELHRLRAILAARRGDGTGARRELDAARRIAERQGAKSLVERTARTARELGA